MGFEAVVLEKVAKVLKQDNAASFFLRFTQCNLHRS